MRLCRLRGADEAEALVIHRTEKAADVFNHRAQMSGESETTRLTLRLFRNNRATIAVGHGSCEAALEDMVEGALIIARHTSPDKFLGPANPQDLGRVTGDLKIFDNRLAQLPMSRVKEIALAAESAVASKESRIANLISSSFQVQTHSVTLCTSHGFCESYEATSAMVMTKAVMDDNNVTMPGGGEKLYANAGLSVRSLDALDVEKVAARTIDRLSNAVGARPSPSGWFPVVFSPLASNFIVSTLLTTFNATTSQTPGRDSLGQIGDSVCSPLITLADDPTLSGGIGTAPFDHEGVKPCRNTIIENGVLKEYLLNSYHARALQRRTTGNAVVSDDTRYNVAPSNVYIEAGNAEPEGIIADIRQGMYVTGYLSFAMPMGNVFTQAATGYWIEDGKLSYPVRIAIISAATRDMLQNISAVGHDLELGMRFNSPTLMVSKMNISPLT